MTHLHHLYHSHCQIFIVLIFSEYTTLSCQSIHDTLATHHYNMVLTCEYIYQWTQSNGELSSINYCQ